MRGCCEADADCRESERCSARGTCELARCVSAEDVSACELALCPGPNCPDPSTGAAPTCSDGVQNGEEADVDCGAACPARCSAGSACEANADCASFNCDSGVCSTATCADAILNQDESDTDCGGGCAPCASGAVCSSDADCGADLFCPPTLRVCTDISCQDGVTNGDEILTDCGGGVCPGCPPGTACEAAEDCESGICGVDGECSAPSCEDDVRNQDETGADCGGICSAGCTSGTPCREAADCDSGVCGTAGCAPGVAECCQQPSCSDGVQNGNEPSIDCGSAASCGLCVVGEPCSANAQCQTGLCEGTCRPPPCADGLLSGSESDVDCGGADPTCARCADGDSCRADSDCGSGDCEGGACISCADGRENGTETDVDCGGPNPSCRRCPLTDDCLVDSDCASDECTGGVCVAFSCNDGIQNGTETGIDCGGNDPECARCPDGSACVQSSDCSNQNCLGGTCISCGDGVINGTETDIDCGGADPFCIRCQAGQLCRVDSDCDLQGRASGACVDGRCCGGSTTHCTRCAERLSPVTDCASPQQGVDAAGVVNCSNFLQCLAANPDVCSTRNAPGCSGDNPADACPHNNFGGNAGTGLTRANQVLQNAGCQL